MRGHCAWLAAFFKRSVASDGGSSRWLASAMLRTTTVPGRKLPLSQDQHPLRAQGVRLSHLRFQAALAGRQDRRDAVAAQCARQLQRFDSRGGPLVRDVGVGRVRRRGGRVPLLHVQDDALDTGREAHGGRRRAAQLFDEVVVAAAGADRALGAAATRLDLEDGAGVVVE